MRNRLRDAILVITVTGALFATGSAFYDTGRRLPPPPKVQSTPTTTELSPELRQLP
jgi:hypothetical protein